MANVWVILTHFPDKPSPDVELVIGKSLEAAKETVQKRLALPGKTVEWTDARNYSVSMPMPPTHWFSIHEAELIY